MCSAGTLSHFSRCLVGLGARHRYRGFATDDPASGACSLSRSLSRERARPGVVIQELFARGRDGPRAACQLLQSNSNPRAQPRPLRTPRHLAFGRPKARLAIALPPLRDGRRDESHRSRERGWQRAPFGIARPTESSRVRGSAQRPLGSWLGAFHRDRSRWKLRPNPIDSDTPCRLLAMSTWTELRQRHRPIARAPFGTSLPRRANLLAQGGLPPCLILVFETAG